MRDRNQTDTYQRDHLAYPAVWKRKKRKCMRQNTQKALWKIRGGINPGHNAQQQQNTPTSRVNRTVYFFSYERCVISGDGQQHNLTCSKELRRSRHSGRHERKLLSGASKPVRAPAALHWVTWPRDARLSRGPEPIGRSVALLPPSDGDATPRAGEINFCCCWLRFIGSRCSAFSREEQMPASYLFSGTLETIRDGCDTLRWIGEKRQSAAAQRAQGGY